MCIPCAITVFYERRINAAGTTSSVMTVKFIRKALVMGLSLCTQVWPQLHECGLRTRGAGLELSNVA